MLCPRRSGAAAWHSVPPGQRRTPRPCQEHLWTNGEAQGDDRRQVQNDHDGEFDLAPADLCNTPPAPRPGPRGHPAALRLPGRILGPGPTQHRFIELSALDASLAGLEPEPQKKRLIASYLASARFNDCCTDFNVDIFRAAPRSLLLGLLSLVAVASVGGLLSQPSPDRGGSSGPAAQIGAGPDRTAPGTKRNAGRTGAIRAEGRAWRSTASWTPRREGEAGPPGPRGEEGHPSTKQPRGDRSP